MFGSDETKTQNAEQELQEKSTNLKNLWVGAKANYKSADEFYKELSVTTGNIARLMLELQTFYTNQDRAIEDQRAKYEVDAKNDEEFSDKAKGVMEQKTNGLVQKRKHLDALKSKMRGLLNNLNAKKPSKLPVDSNENLQKFFRLIWDIYYAKDYTKSANTVAFDWKNFKKHAFLKDKCDDFVTRLVQIDFAALSANQIEEIQNIKKWEYINVFATEDAQGENILDILDYFEFVPETCETEKAIHELEKEIQKIKVKAPTKKLNAKSLRDKIVRNKETQDFLQENFSKHGKFIENFSEEFQKFQNIASGYIKHKNNIKTNVVDKYDSIRDVPQTIYN